MSCNWQLCSDLCASKHPFFIGLSPVHTNGHRGAEPRLHLTSPHKARSLEPTSGTEIALTHPKPKHVHTPTEIVHFSRFCPEISGRCQLGSLLFTSSCHWGWCVTYIKKTRILCLNHTYLYLKLSIGLLSLAQYNTSSPALEKSVVLYMANLKFLFKLYTYIYIYYFDLI